MGRGRGLIRIGLSGGTVSPAPPRRKPRSPPAKPIPGRKEGTRAQEILDTAFHQATKISSSGRTRIDRGRSLTLRKITRASSVLLRHLSRRRAPFRKWDTFSPFTQALLTARLGEGQLERSMRRLRVAEERLLRFRAEEERRIPRIEEKDDFRKSLKRYYGRASSVLHEIEEDIVVLERGQSILRRSPVLDASATTLVVIGLPNVGKSSLVSLLSSASPKVAAYPFTTLNAIVGHATLTRAGATQMVDTPGLLERDGRPVRGATAVQAEREAIAAIESTEGPIVFLIDPSETCGWTLEAQHQLLLHLRTRYPEREILPVENKIDLVRTDSPNLKISCETGEGIEELRKVLGEIVSRHIPSWEDLYEATNA